MPYRFIFHYQLNLHHCTHPNMYFRLNEKVLENNRKCIKNQRALYNYDNYHGIFCMLLKMNAKDKLNSMLKKQESKEGNKININFEKDQSKLSKKYHN